MRTRRPIRALHATARILLAGLFIYGGIDTVRDPGPRAEQAAALLAQLRRVLFMPDDLVVVRLNAAVQATAGWP